MNKLKIFKLGIIVVLWVALGAIKTYAQSGREQVHFSIPKNIYFGGERIWVSSKVEQGNEEVESQIIYAELLNRYNESVAIAKMPLENGASFNFLKLPQNLPSDHYLLRVFTRISPYQDLDSGMSQQLITVFNRLAPSGVVEKRTETTVFQPKSDDLVSISSNEFSSGSKISVKLKGNENVRELSVAVVNPFLSIQHQLKSSEVYESLEQKVMVPELFGHIIEAKVQPDQVDTTQLYYISVHGDKSALFTDRPDPDGTMFFDAGGVRNWNYLVAQANGNKSLLDFTIVSPAPKTHFKKSFEFPVLEITPSDEPYLKELLKGGQVEGYFVHEFNSSDAPVVTGFVEDRVYQLDDYTRFETVETIVKEYIPEISVKTVQKKKEFRSINEIKSFAFESNPLMLVDAMPVFDSDQLAAFDPKGFKTLAILSRTFYLNEEEFPGVMSFYSYKNDFGGFPIPTNGILLDYAGIQPRITLATSLFEPSRETDEMMDWRTILYWTEIPQLSSSKNEVEIVIPELKGSFLVTIKTDQGTYTKVIEVK
ncbi:hypothetical protein JYB62_17110 [Algoriphagus lutimaris]|uniref:hypothetical protein n=1 Tax=Algoriphagus lutimaris TaxID=613197 RepID=UPI00196B380C|nr:hypothetical protein [Algoriphagus lutimaris]MBN3521731.1 hypothetical protein [Algoriphagus lutimaris]